MNTTHIYVEIGTETKRKMLERNWIQACMMGAENKPAEKFVRLLKKELAR